MSSIIQPREPKNTFAKMIPPLLIGMLGVFGIVALYALGFGLRAIEFMPLVVIVCAAAVGYRRGIVRGILTIIILYLATLTAALLYQSVAPYTNAMKEIASFNLDASVEDIAPIGVRGFTFALLVVAFWLILELIGKATFQAPELPQIGILDNLGGVMVHVIVGVLVASLLFHVVGFGRSRPQHNVAYLRQPFSMMIEILYTTQSFFFRTPPPIYTYDLNAY